jgi:hypothetical protein
VPIRITAEPGSSTTSLKLETEGDDHTEQEPGLMLFHDRNQHRLLMVLLVGESPVRGVNRTALRGALDQVAWLSGWRSGDPRYQHHAPEALVCLAQAGRSAHDNSPRIRILGPTFSGSAESIRFTLENWFHSFPTAPPHAISATSCWSTTSHLTIDPTAETVRVDIVSGSATGVDTSFQHDARINYKTVRLPSEVMQQHIITELKQHLDAGDDHPRIAFLTEETSYGSATYDAAKGNEKADLLAQNVSTYSYPFLELPFPLHISDLRNSEGVVQSQPAQLAPNLGHRDLALGGESGPDETDVVPSFSPRSAVYESLILTQLFRTIHRERIRYVGIVATDIEDLIFLVREIRANCPDTEPFVINSDLRYLHSDINSALVGTLVFANYPLFSMSERFTWPFGAERRIQFPTEMAQGAYNAMLVLLHDRDNHDKLLDRLLDYGEPLQAARPKGDLPGLWEGVVGRNDIWPIRASVPEPVANNVFRRYTVPGQFKLDFATGIYPVSFQIAIFIFSIICLSAAVILLHPARFGTVPSLHRILGDAIIQDWALERRLLVSAVALGFLTAYTVAGGFALLPLELEHLLGTVADHRRFLGYATELVVIVVSSALLAATIRSLLRLGGCPRPKPQFPVMAGLLLITGVIQLLLSGFFVYSIWTSDRTTILFTFLRSANLGNGVSPLLPLIFAGVGGLTLLACQLERLRLLEDCSTRTSQTADVSFTGLAGQDSFYGVDQQEEKITRLLECRPLTLPGARILLALLIVGLVYDVAYFCWIDRDPWRAIDGRWFYFLFLAVSATVYGLFALLLLRFVQGLLRRLYWHPSRIGYDELRRRSIPSRSEEQRVGLFEPPPSRTAVEGALENARTLLHRANSIGNSGAAAPLTETLSERLKANVLELRATVRDAELGFSRLLEREAAGDIPSTVSRRLDLHTAMARLSRVIVTIFEPEWRARTNPLLVTTPFRKKN